LGQRLAQIENHEWTVAGRAGAELDRVQRCWLKPRANGAVGPWCVSRGMTLNLGSLEVVAGSEGARVVGAENSLAVGQGLLVERDCLV
jgi:hypothetical protein